MAKIRFTIGDSDVWHEIHIDYELSNAVIRDEHDLSYIIKAEQDKCRKGKAKKVEVIDDEGNLVAKSSDILDWNKLVYINKKNETD